MQAVGLGVEKVARGELGIEADCFHIRKTETRHMFTCYKEQPRRQGEPSQATRLPSNISTHLPPPALQESSGRASTAVAPPEQEEASDR